MPRATHRQRRPVSLGGRLQAESAARIPGSAGERLVHPVAGERVDEPGRVADEDGASPLWPRAGTPSGQPVAAQPRDGAEVDAVLGAEPAQVLPEARPLA